MGSIQLGPRPQRHRGPLVRLLQSGQREYEGPCRERRALRRPGAITTVRIYETIGAVQTATQALLWIHPKNGVLPTTVSDSLELEGLNVNITAVNETPQVVRVSATGLDIELPAGDYWVSLCPKHSYGGVAPYTYHLITSGPVIGDPSPAIVACTSNSNWVYPLDPNRPDYAIKIEGEIHRPLATAPTGQRGEVPGP